MKTYVKIKEKLKNSIIRYRLLFLLICGTCIILHFRINDEIFNAQELGYFTVQSNILCFIVMFILVIKDFTDCDITRPVFIYFKGMATSAIVCTGYIYHFAESINKYSLAKDGIFSIPIEDLLAHYFVPVMFVLDWFIFQPKGLFQKKYILQWLAFPIVYFICFLIRTNMNDASTFLKVEKFPYFFMDYETLGTSTFSKYIFMIIIMMIIINTVIYTLDFIMAQYKVYLKRDTS